MELITLLLVLLAGVMIGAGAAAEYYRVKYLTKLLKLSDMLEVWADDRTE